MIFFMERLFAAYCLWVNSARDNRHHMHQHPAQAPFGPNSFAKSFQEFGATGQNLSLAGCVGIAAHSIRLRPQFAARTSFSDVPGFAIPPKLLTMVMFPI
jgi:hypothetical protein